MGKSEIVQRSLNHEKYTFSYVGQIRDDETDDVAWFVGFNRQICEFRLTIQAVLAAHHTVLHMYST